MRPATLLRLAALALLVSFLLAPQWFAPLFAPLTEYGAPPIYDQGNLLTLALAHLGTVLLAAAASTVVAVGLGILVTRPGGPLNGIHRAHGHASRISSSRPADASTTMTSAIADPT